MLGKRGSMMLFLRGLPEDVTRKELKDFIQAAAKYGNNRLFPLSASICNCSILRITDPSNGKSELHGLVEIQPAKAAMRAIDALNGSELKGARIEARRYRHRSPLRDRRREEIVPDHPDNRHKERRRKNLRIDLVGV